jgi:hypothetical protein
MARYKPIDLSPKLITVDFSRQILPGSFEYALCYLPESTGKHYPNCK